MSEVFHATDSQVKRLGARTDTLEATAKTLTKGLADEIARAKKEENRLVEVAASAGSSSGSSVALEHINTIEKIVFPAIDTLQKTDDRHNLEISELRSCIDCSIVGDLCSLENTVYCDHEPRIQSLKVCVDSSFSLLGSLENSLTNYGCSLDCLSCCYSSLSSTVSELDNNVESLSTRIDNIPTEYPYLPLNVTCETIVTIGEKKTLSFEYYLCSDLPGTSPLFQIGVANGGDFGSENAIAIGEEYSYNTDIKIFGNCISAYANTFYIEADAYFSGCVCFGGDVWFKHTPVGCAGSNMVNLSDTINELLESSSGSNEFDYLVVKAGCGSVYDSKGIDFCAGSYHTCFGNSNAYIMGSYIGGCDGYVSIDMYATDGIKMKSHVYFECGVTFSQCDTITFNGSTNFYGCVSTDNFYSNSISTDYISFYKGNIYSCGDTLCLYGCNLDLVSTGKIRIIDDCYSKGISVGCDCVSIDTNVNFLGACNIILDGNTFVFDGMALQSFQNGSVQSFSCGTSSTFNCGSNLFIENGAGIAFFECMYMGHPTGETLTLDYATVKKLLSLLPAGSATA